MTVRRSVMHEVLAIRQERWQAVRIVTFPERRSGTQFFNRGETLSSPPIQ
jgi:hypothetical protein